MKKLFIITLFLLFRVDMIYCQSDIIFATYKYVMGDNDTKNDAKRICFLEAKRLCIEKAGTFLESYTEITNYRLTRDEIKTYAAALLKVDIASEEIKFIGESVTIIMTVNAEVDGNYLKEKIKQIKNNTDLDIKIKEKQKQLDLLEIKLKNLQQQLTTDNINEIIKTRKDRKELFDKMSELEMIKLDIQTKTKLAVENVELSMTPAEVIKVAGQPRSIRRNSVDSGWLRYNYGQVWVIIDNGVVTCLVKAEYFSEVYERSHYQTYRPQAIIK